MLSLPIATQLYARALANGGFTYRVADGAYPTDGFAVAIQGHERQFRRNFSPEAIALYMQERRNVFDSAGHCLGAWCNDGLWYLDVSIVLPTYRQALEEGRRNMQIAVYDLARGESINVETVSVA